MHHEGRGDVSADRLSLGLLIGERAEEVAQSGGSLLRGEILLRQADQLHELVHVPSTERDRDLVLHHVSVERLGEIGVALLQRLPIVEPRRVALVLGLRHISSGIAAFGTEDPLRVVLRRDPRASFGLRTTRVAFPST